ncbi:MAG TPA: O-antigen ligase family protein [Lacunisphaera sp.]|nr:O-antigen ligase family protein [Lacunisphaera sp.]
MPAPDSSPRSRRRRTTQLEKLVTAHFLILVVFTSWAFAGQAAWVRQAITLWGAIGGVLFIFAAQGQGASVVRLLWPLAVYDGLVAGSCLNPGMKEMLEHGTRVLVVADPIPWLPSAAVPRDAATELALFNAIVISAFNLWLALSGRGAIRRLLLIMSANAVALAVFGTFQKLSRAGGLWFGLVHSPNDKFFSTFIYHNHWGAFTLLNTTACLGLLFHAVRRGGTRDVWHSPVLMGAVVTLLLAATVPLSASRSCTTLMALLLTGALLHFLARLIRRRREQHESAVLPVAGIVLAVLIALAAVAYLGRDVIAQRAALTSRQLAGIATEDTLNSRLALYRDTWRMAMAKPWFGWGLESYPHVFRIFNSQRTVETWWWIPFYARAHNDWLQSLAETGFVGTILLALLVLLPLAQVRWRDQDAFVPRYLLAGCAIILLYAWVEFPFDCPAVLLTFGAHFYAGVRYAMLDVRAQDEERLPP